MMYWRSPEGGKQAMGDIVQVAPLSRLLAALLQYVAVNVSNQIVPSLSTARSGSLSGVTVGAARNFHETPPSLEAQIAPVLMLLGARRYRPFA
jgi:hypothetical protein